jgi:hypothetical protein
VKQIVERIRPRVKASQLKRLVSEISCLFVNVCRKDWKRFRAVCSSKVERAYLVKNVIEMQPNRFCCSQSPCMKEHKLRNLKAAELAAGKFRRKLYRLQAELCDHPRREVQGNPGSCTPFRA